MITWWWLLACRPGAVDPPTTQGPSQTADSALSTSTTESSPTTAHTGVPAPTASTAAPTATTGDTAAPRPNVLVVVADDMGVDKLATYGAPGLLPRMPVVEGLASTGLVFERAYALPRSAPARATLLTGRTPSQHGIGTGITATDALGLPDSELTLPELLEAAGAGYASAAIGKWHLGTHTHGAGMSPLLQGFDHHAGSLASLLDGWSLDGRPQDYFDWEKSTDGVVARTTAYATTACTDDALAAVATLPEPWLMWVSYNAPHVPLHLPPAGTYTEPVIGDHPDQQRFNAMLEAMDHELGRLLDGLDPAVAARTTILFLGDNGTPDHGIPAPLPADRGKDTLFEGGVHIPLIAAGFGVQTGRSTALVDATDLAPTVGDLAGVDLHSVADLAGASFAPSLSSPTLPGARTRVFAEYFEPNHAPVRHDRMVHDGEYKLIERSFDGQTVHELYELSGFVEGDDLLQEPLSSDAAAAYAALLQELP